jgi:hypothetical protein
MLSAAQNILVLLRRPAGGKCSINEHVSKEDIINILHIRRYLASDNCSENEHLCTYNHVLDPYCSQDLHSGQVTTASDESFGLYFAGHLILAATLDNLDKLHNLTSATEIIICGVSAGGIGVWMNVDYVAQRYDHETVSTSIIIIYRYCLFRYPNARVTAATVAGHYFYASYYTGVNHTDPSKIKPVKSLRATHIHSLISRWNGRLPRSRVSDDVQAI